MGLHTQYVPLVRRAEDQYIPSDSLPVAIFEVLKPIWRQLSKPQRSLERDVVGNVPKDKLCGS